MRKTVFSIALVALVAFVSCGGDSTGGHEGHAGMEAGGGSVPGAPADASEATQTVKVSTLDQLRFDPATIKVSAGDVVTFVVTNEGKSEHEFVLGDAEYQEAHGDDMDHDMSEGNAVMVAPGETEELTWRFEESGEVLYGCHVSGHYDGGMVGKVEVG